MTVSRIGSNGPVTQTERLSPLQELVNSLNSLNLSSSPQASTNLRTRNIQKPYQGNRLILAKTYYHYALTLSNDETIRMPDGKKYAKHELLLAAIKLDSNFAPAYYLLACILPSRKDTISVKRYLFRKTIELNPNFSEAYYHLALTLPNNETKKALFSKAIELNPNFLEAYYHLALTLPNNETKKALFLKFLELDRKYRATEWKIENIIKTDPQFFSDYKS